MFRRPITISLTLLVAAGTATASPRGLEFSTDTLPGDTETKAVNFSVNETKDGTCYTLVDSMGNTVAAACRGEGGWDFHGGAEWTLTSEGRLSAIFEGDPNISRIYAEDANRARGGIGEAGWSVVNPDEITRKARLACEDKIILPPDANISIKVGLDECEVVFMGSDGEGGAVCLAMVVIDHESGLVGRVEVP